jgi:cell division protein FtsW
MLERRSKTDMAILAVPVVLLVLYGIGLIYSSSQGFVGQQKSLRSVSLLQNHLVNLAAAFVAFGVGFLMPYHIWKRLSRYLFGIASVLLIAVLIPGVGEEMNGARRWLRVGILIQPSEIMKFALVVFLAAKLSDTIAARRIENGLDGFVYPLIPVVLVCGLVALQPNYSMAGLIFLISFVMLFVAGTKLGYFLTSALVAIPLGASVFLFNPNRLNRLKAFLDPLAEGNATGFGMQQLQGLIALANGGISGVGIGKSTQKFFMPEAYTDMIYSVLGEELGFLLGTLPVLVFLGVLVWGALRIANHAPDSFGKLLAVGLSAALFFNTLVHVLVCVQWMPVTGQTLPFVSYGGTSLIVNLFAIGVLLNIGKRRTE